MSSVSKGKPYLWLATNQRLATIQPIPNTGVKVNEAKEQVQFLKGNHTRGSQPTCGSRQTLHVDSLPRGKSKDGRSLTSNVTPTPFNASTATPTPKLPISRPLLLKSISASVTSGCGEGPSSNLSRWSW